MDNPTSTDLASQNMNGGAGSGPGIDGGIVALKSYGAKTNTFFNAKWQFSANALYQLPAGFEVAAALWGRQGYPTANYLNLDAGGDGAFRAIATPLDATRYDDLWNLDLRLAKNTTLGGNATCSLTVDLFNVFNNDLVLVRSRQVNSENFGKIGEIINPRILRVGVGSASSRTSSWGVPRLTSQLLYSDRRATAGSRSLPIRSGGPSSDPSARTGGRRAESTGPTRRAIHQRAGRGSRRRKTESRRGET